MDIDAINAVFMDALCVPGQRLGMDREFEEYKVNQHEEDQESFHSSCSSSYHPHPQGHRSMPLFIEPDISATQLISKNYNEGGMLTGSKALLAFL